MCKHKRIYIPALALLGGRGKVSLHALSSVCWYEIGLTQRLDQMYTGFNLLRCTKCWPIRRTRKCFTVWLLYLCHWLPHPSGWLLMGYPRPNIPEFLPSSWHFACFQSTSICFLAIRLSLRISPSHHMKGCSVCSNVLINMLCRNPLEGSTNKIAWEKSEPVKCFLTEVEIKQ